MLHKARIWDYFDAIASAEFTRQGKPEPDVYLAALDQLAERAEHCLAIEDSNSGIRAAKRAGLKVIAIKNNPKNTNIESSDFEMQSFLNIDDALFSKVFHL